MALAAERNAFALRRTSMNDEYEVSVTESELGVLAALRAGTHVVVPRERLHALLGELDASDGYAVQENPGAPPSVWQIKNSLLRETVNAILAASDPPA
jgi:hypothetical protein